MPATFREPSSEDRAFARNLPSRRTWWSEARNDRPTWLIEPLCARGAVTGVIAEPKAGKTTFVLNAIKAAMTGTFLGRSCRPCRVVYVTEEYGTALEAFERARLTPDDAFLPVDRPRLPVCRGTSWDRSCVQ